MVIIILLMVTNQLYLAAHGQINLLFQLEHQVIKETLMEYRFSLLIKIQKAYQLEIIQLLMEVGRQK